MYLDPMAMAQCYKTYLTLDFSAYLSTDSPTGWERKGYTQLAGHAPEGKRHVLPCSSTVP